MAKAQRPLPWPKTVLVTSDQPWQIPVWMATPPVIPRKKSLRSRLLGRVCLSLFFYPVVLFIPAGTVKFWQGWAFMAVSFIPSLVSTIYFYKRDPKLLERRMLGKEKVKAQKVIMLLMRLLYVYSLPLAGLDFRCGWSRGIYGPLPWWLTLLALCIVLSCHVLFFQVIKVNRFAASIIQIEAGQTVTAAGPYRIVRHPMYAGGIVMWLCTPLALGSYVALPFFALVIPVFVLRLLNEEKMLRQKLPGYSEYCRRTRYRLIPFVW